MAVHVNVIEGQLDSLIGSPGEVHTAHRRVSAALVVVASFFETNCDAVLSNKGKSVKTRKDETQTENWKHINLNYVKKSIVHTENSLV